MSIHHIKDLVEIIQTIVLTLAVVIGGGWAAYRFWSLKEIAKARAELEEKEKSLTERGTLSIDLSTDLMPRPDHGGYYVNLRASITNVGNRAEILYWKKGRAYAAPVLQELDGKIILGERIEAQLMGILGEQISVTIAPSERVILPFLLSINNPGVYYLGIRVPRSSKEKLEEVKYATDILPSDFVSWGADTYIQIGLK